MSAQCRKRATLVGSMFPSRAPRRSEPWGLRTVLLGLFLAFTTSSAARADEVRVHGLLGGSHAVGGSQQRELGFGALGGLALEWPPSHLVGLQLGVEGVVLGKGKDPVDPSLAPRSTGVALLTTVGIRLHPAQIAGLWADVDGGLAATGGLARPTLGAHLGYDFRAGKGRLDVGPFVGYSQIFQSDSELRPDDARILSVGAHVGLGAVEKREQDRDHDRVLDSVDACPDTPGVGTHDPRTNGCADRDRDTLFDVEDACPDVAGERSADPRDNGCPPADTDGDGELDRVDACPNERGVHSQDPKANGCPKDSDRDGVLDMDDACVDVPGEKSSNPKLNGCPKDTDRDGIPDTEDACPSIPGRKTDDPKTTGCPDSHENIRLERDEILLPDIILFDTDSPRVRHVSWPLVKRLAEFIDKTPDILEVSIQGHADATGSAAHNLRLSRERAESVKRLLVKYGVDKDRILAEAFGISRPRIKTSNAEQQNRRVEFLVTRTRPQADPAGEVSP